jgi:hypothetical protein
LHDEDNPVIPFLRRYLPLAAAAAPAFSLQLLATPAAAHIELQLPMNRYSDIRAGENKACPCGAGSTTRRCNIPADFSDDNRSSDRVTTFAPGDTIKVRFDEYVGHDGRYRIAFDPDGADLPDFNQYILLDEPDPRGSAGNLEGGLWEFEVTLPDMVCDNCTLQLIQVMDGNTVDRVLDPSTRGGTYFQCADIVLAEGTPAGGIPPANPTEHEAVTRPAERPPAMMAEPEEPEDEMMASAPMTGSAMTGGAMTGSAMTGSSSGTPAAADPMSPAASSGGACSLTLPGSSGSTLPALAVLAGAVAAFRRRRRRQSK